MKRRRRVRARLRVRRRVGGRWVRVRVRVRRRAGGRLHSGGRELRTITDYPQRVCWVQCPKHGRLQRIALNLLQLCSIFIPFFQILLIFTILALLRFLHSFFSPFKNLPRFAQYKTPPASVTCNYKNLTSRKKERNQKDEQGVLQVQKHPSNIFEEGVLVLQWLIADSGGFICYRSFDF